MKIVVNLIYFASLAVVIQKTLAGGDDDFKEISEKCQTRFDITFAEYEAVQNVATDQEIDKKYKCFAHCIVVEMDTLDASGKVDVDKIIQLYELDKETADKINDCKAEHDMNDDACDYAFAMMGCIMSQ